MADAERRTFSCSVRGIPAPKGSKKGFVISEASFQSTVLDLLALRGWRVAHFRPARTAKGWRTAVSADGAGFPDILAVREYVEPNPLHLCEALALELKSSSKKVKPTPEQEAWLHDLGRVPGVQARVLRAGDDADWEWLLQATDTAWKETP